MIQLTAPNQKKSVIIADLQSFPKLAFLRTAGHSFEGRDIASGLKIHLCKVKR